MKLIFAVFDLYYTIFILFSRESDGGNVLWMYPGFIPQ